MPGHHGTPGIRALLCDIDGVLRIWPPVADLERSHGLPPGSIAAAAFSPARLLPAITGAITDAQWRTSVAAAAEHVGVPARACLFVDDTPANVDAATEIGMTALLYQNVTELRECVTRLRERAT